MTPIEFHTSFSHTEKTKYHEGSSPEELFVYDCPFCDSTGHLYFFPKTTTWDCKKCGRKGNTHIFNQLIYNEVCTKKIGELRELWSLPVRVFENVKFNPLNDSWVLPSFREGRMNNLYKIVVVRDKKKGEWRDVVRVMATPSLHTTLLDWPKPESDTVWVCEGQKDKLAADAIIGSREIEAVGVPGASSFQERWAFALQDKDVVICFDNDSPGKEGTKKIVDILSTSPYKPRSVKKIAWPEETEEGFDLYDAFQYHRGGTYNYLNSHIQEIIQEDLTKVTSEVVIADDSCDTFEKMISVVEGAYHVTSDLRTAFLVVLASIYSTNLDGEQVWVKLIGRPGCGKSTLSKAVSASEFVQSMSTFTSLFSGWKDGDEEDPSMVPLIKNKTLIVKDADALLKQSNIEKIMSELRDFYDKDSTVRYGNRQAYNYQNIRATFILMGTQVLRRADQSFLGERLLSLEMDVKPKDEEMIKKRVVQNALCKALGRPVTDTKEVMAAVKGFIGHIKDVSQPNVEIPEAFTDMINRLSSLAAHMRTQVDRDFQRKVLSPAVSEVPSRLIGQLINTGISLCVVLKLKEPNDEVIKIVKKILKDTINPRSHRFAICDAILDSPGITAKVLMERTDLSKKVIEHELEDLLELKLVEIRLVEGAKYGSKLRGFWLSRKIKKEFEEITR